MGIQSADDYAEVGSQVLIPQNELAHKYRNQMLIIGPPNIKLKSLRNAQLPHMPIIMVTGFGSVGIPSN